jgi:hypothetical protein
MFLNNFEWIIDAKENNNKSRHKPTKLAIIINLKNILKTFNNVFILLIQQIYNIFYLL